MPGARTIVGGLATASAAVLLRSAVRRARTEERKADTFYEWTGSTEVWPTTDGIPARCPAYVHSIEFFGSFHSADLGAVTEALPTDALHPVRIAGDRAVVVVAGLRYGDMTNAAFEGPIAPPYGEAQVALLVTEDPAPRVLPLASLLPLPKGWRAGLFGLYIPVSHRWARDAGLLMGFPKFIADLDFAETVTTREVSVSEGGRRILRLRVPARGQVRRRQYEMPQFCAREGALYRVDVRVSTYERMTLGSHGAELEIGDHVIAGKLRDLGLSSEAILTTSWLTGRAIMPSVRRVGDARSISGYPGREEWFGRYSVAYPGTKPVDQYAYLTRAGLALAIGRGGGTVPSELQASEEHGAAPLAATLDLPGADRTRQPAGVG